MCKELHLQGLIPTYAESGGGRGLLPEWIEFKIPDGVSKRGLLTTIRESQSSQWYEIDDSYEYSTDSVIEVIRIWPKRDSERWG